jgi:hypothetical protein
MTCRALLKLQKKLLIPSFGFVYGNDFSRPVKSS